MGWGEMLTPNFEGIPASLRRTPHWLCWVAIPQDGKVRKPPVQAAGQNRGRLASPTNPAHWTDFESARRFYEQYKEEPLQGGRLAGVGFALTRDLGIVGIDLDGVVHNGEIQPWAAAIVKKFDTYAEISPSGRGVHIFLKGALLWAGKRTSNVEIYAHGRYLTVTGHWLNCGENFHAKSAA